MRNATYTHESVTYIINNMKLIVVDMVLGTTNTVDLRPFEQVLGVPSFDESIFDDYDPYSHHKKDDVQELAEQFFIQKHISSGNTMDILRFILLGSKYVSSDFDNGKFISVWEGLSSQGVA